MQCRRCGVMNPPDSVLCDCGVRIDIRGYMWYRGVETGILRYISSQRPYLTGPVRLGILRSPFTTGGKSFSSSYTSVMNRSLLCFVSPSVVAS